MDASVELGFQLFVLGMVAVFAVLGGVVLTGRLAIGLANRWARRHQHSPPARLSAKKIAAVIAAVQAATGGRARIRSIEAVERPKDH